MQNLTITGNLGRDPEMKMTPGGAALCKFSVGASSRAKEADGTWGKKTTWYSCTVWGKLAETAEKYLRKGSKVLVTGTFDFREYAKQDGSKGFSMDLNVTEFENLTPRDENSENTRPAAAPAPAAAPGYEDDITF